MADLREIVARAIAQAAEQNGGPPFDAIALTGGKHALANLYDEADAVLTALREAGALHEWRPIEEAPKDGERVLLWVEPHEDHWGTQKACAVIGNWVVWPDRERRTGMRDGWSWYGPAQCYPTHWMPLPTPPGEAK